MRVKTEIKLCNKFLVELMKKNITSATNPIFTKLKLCLNFYKYPSIKSKVPIRVSIINRYSKNYQIIARKER